MFIAELAKLSDGFRNGIFKREPRSGVGQAERVGRVGAQGHLAEGDARGCFLAGAVGLWSQGKRRYCVAVGGAVCGLVWGVLVLAGCLVLAAVSGGEKIRLERGWVVAGEKRPRVWVVPHEGVMGRGVARKWRREHSGHLPEVAVAHVSEVDWRVPKEDVLVVGGGDEEMVLKIRERLLAGGSVMWLAPDSEPNKIFCAALRTGRLRVLVGSLSRKAVTSQWRQMDGVESIKGIGDFWGGGFLNLL